jgi:hypothetical protein
MSLKCFFRATFYTHFLRQRLLSTSVFSERSGKCRRGLTAAADPSDWSTGALLRGISLDTLLTGLNNPLLWQNCENGDGPLVSIRTTNFLSS